LILSAEGYLSVGLGGKLWVDDWAIGTIHVQAESLEEFSLPLGFDRDFPYEDGMDNVSLVDVLVAWISVLVFILVLVIAPIALPRCFSGVALNGLLCVDAFEDAAFSHCVVGFGMKLAWPFKGFIVVLLIITSTSKLFDCVDFLIIVVGSFTPEIITVVTTLVPPFSVVAVIGAPKAAFVKTSTVVSGVIPSRLSVTSSLMSISASASA